MAVTCASSNTVTRSASPDLEDLLLLLLREYRKRENAEAGQHGLRPLASGGISPLVLRPGEIIGISRERASVRFHAENRGCAQRMMIRTRRFRLDRKLVHESVSLFDLLRSAWEFLMFTQPSIVSLERVSRPAGGLGLRWMRSSCCSTVWWRHHRHRSVDLNLLSVAFVLTGVFALTSSARCCLPESSEAKTDLFLRQMPFRAVI